jgi:hypothetical protein
MTKHKITSGKKAELFNEGNWQDHLVQFVESWAHDQINADGTGPTWKMEIERAKQELLEKLETTCTEIEENLHNGEYYV